VANYNLKRFADPDALKRMQQRYLLALLKPHQPYFTRRGLIFPAADDGELDHEFLSGILLSPDENISDDLADTLYSIDEMATDDAMDDPIKASTAAGLSLDQGPEMTPADVAVQVWMVDRDLFERKHAEQLAHRPRSFQSFQSVDSPRREIDPSPGQRAALETDFDNWFEANKRGGGCRVFVFPEDEEVYFVVRHGQPYKREGKLQGKKSTSVCYRPEKHDIVVYSPISGELRMNAASQREKELYRTAFGLRLFGSEDHFPGTAKYTLDPLREQGEASLVCSEVDGMQWVKLTEIRYLWRGTPSEIEVRKSDDLFAVLRHRQAQIPPRARIIGATFAVQFTDAKTPRSVSVLPPNITKYSRDDDGKLVEQWLSLRGFILTERLADENADSVLVGA